MKAVIKHGPGKGISVEEVPVPDVSSGEVLVRVRAASICGSDLHMWAGHSGYDWVRYPLILGHEIVGEIAAVGPGVLTQRIGQRVVINPYVGCGECPACLAGSPQLCAGSGSAMDKTPSTALQVGFRAQGGFASYLTVPQQCAVPLPDQVTYRAGAPLEGFAVSVHAVQLSGARPGARVGVLGPGPIGLGVLLALRDIRPTMVVLAGLSSDEHRLALGRELGATHTVMVDRQNLEAEVAALTDSGGLDIIFDATGSPAALEPAIRSLRRGGELVLVGISGRRAEIPVDQIVRGEIVLRGSYGITPAALDRAAALVATGVAPLDRMVSRVMTIAAAAEAFAFAAAGAPGKVVLVPDDDLT